MSKEKKVEDQIMEMAHCLCRQDYSCGECDSDYRCEFLVESSILHKVGYRKQNEGHWMTYHCTNGVKSKRGRNIIYKTYTCDVCGKSNGRHKSNYCSNCGAKMKGGAE